MKPLLSELFLPCSGMHSPIRANPYPLTTITGAQRPPVKLTHGLALTKTTPTSALTAAQLTRFMHPGAQRP